MALQNKINKTTTSNVITKSKPEHGALSLLSKLIPLILICLLSFSATSYAADDKKLIAITQIVEHPSLAEARLGIIDVLAKNGYKIGENLEIIDNNAQGSIANSLIIAKKFVAMNPVAIVAISTPSAQSVISAAKGTDLPIIFSSVTDPVAAGIVKNMQESFPNITGAIDFPLISEEIELIRTLAPGTKRIGLLYSSGEANSVRTIALIREEIKGKIDYIESAVTSSNEVAAAANALVGKVDAIYIPSDNTVFSAMPKLIQISRKHKIPVFSSDPDSVKQGVTACIGYTQYAVGQAAGELLVKALQGQKNLAIQKPASAEVFINKKSADIMGIKIPDQIIGIKPEIVEKD